MVGTRTEQLWTIPIPNLFGIRAPTVLYKLRYYSMNIPKNSDLCESNGGCGEGAGVVVVPDPVRVLDGHLGKQVSLVLSERIHQVQSKHTGWY